MLVLSVRDGRILAARHLREAARTLAAPGSTLKPIVLYQAIEQGSWTPDRRIWCPGDLKIAGRRLACSHPAAPAFDARQALAWSCNAYFAQVARTLTGAQVGNMLRRAELLERTGAVNEEATAEFDEPRTPEQTQLALLGVQGIRVSPLELGFAYRWLARELSAHPGTPAALTVQHGLQDATSYGTAEAAGLGKASVAGKTGTAEGAGTMRTHGWFVGLAPASSPEVVLVIYVPGGRGADAARLAGTVLRAGQTERK